MGLSIRPATPADAPVIFAFIRDLASKGTEFVDEPDERLEA